MAVSAEDLENRIVYVNGEYVAARDARLSIFDRGFLFGDGIYEVTAVLEGKLIDSEPHMRACAVRPAKSASQCRWMKVRSLPIERD
jgi:hypothetical protein